MNKSPLFKYKLGLAVIGVFSLVIVVIVMVQAGNVKHDRQTYKKAHKVAEKLDNYVTIKGIVPNSLSAAGINDVPDEVTYSKLSSTRYRFCVDYKLDSSGFDATYLETQAVTGGRADEIYDRDDGDSTYLYVSEYHRKGQNCQTVKTYSYDDYNYDTNYPSSEDDFQSL